MSNHDSWRILLLLARKDIKSARILATSEEPDPAHIGFHLQQATEKSLKAWLERRGLAIPKTHDLSQLLGILEESGEDVERWERLVELNPFAVQFRYTLYEDEPLSDWRALSDQVEQLVRLVEEIS